MSKKIIAQDTVVLIGADVHTISHVLSAKAHGEILETCSLPARPEAWRSHLGRFPGCEIHVIYEAGPHGYNLHDWLKEMKLEDGAGVTAHIAPPAQIPVAPGKKGVKTDRRDSRRLILAFEMGAFRDVAVPEKAARGEREVVRTRDQFVREASRHMNQIHGFVKNHGLSYPEQPLWGDTWRAALLKQAKASGAELHFALRVKFKLLAEVRKAVAALDKRIARLFREGVKSEVARVIQEQKGIGILSAMVIATEVADFGGFDNSQAFASYVGVVPKERSTGEAIRRGPITKEGNSRLRWVFVECAWTWIRYDKEAAKIYAAIRKRRGSGRAIVAMARKLAVKIYHRVVAKMKEREVPSPLPQAARG